jgi:hypothetical protein
VGERDGTNLFVDRVSLSEYKVTTEQPCEKGIMRSSLPTVQFPLEEKKGLVNGDEFCEIHGMLFWCAQDDFEPLVPTAGFFFSKFKWSERDGGVRCENEI